MKISVIAEYKSVLTENEEAWRTFLKISVKHSVSGFYWLFI